MARGEGIAMLINMFFGVALNAAVGIANTVTTAIGGFSGNIIMAVRPQLIKRYAAGEYEAMLKLMNIGTILSFILMTYLCVPLMSEMHFVLNLWLGLVPDYACVFTDLVLAFNVIGCMSSVVMIVVHATGKIKKTSIFNGTIYILVLPVTYIAYKLGAPAWIPFAYNAFAFLIGTLANTYFMMTYIPQLTLLRYVTKTIIPCFLMFGIVALPSVLLHYYMEEGWLRIILSIVITVVMTTFVSYQFMLDREMRDKVISAIITKIRKK